MYLCPHKLILLPSRHQKYSFCSLLVKMWTCQLFCILLHRQWLVFFICFLLFIMFFDFLISQWSPTVRLKEVSCSTISLCAVFNKCLFNPFDARKLTTCFWYVDQLELSLCNFGRFRVCKLVVKDMLDISSYQWSGICSEQGENQCFS